jgi:hypothetical protein
VTAAEHAKRLQISDGLNSLPPEVQRRIEELDGSGDDTAVNLSMSTFRSQDGRRQRQIKEPNHGQYKKKEKKRATDIAEGQSDREQSGQSTRDEPTDPDIASAEAKRKHKNTNSASQKVSPSSKIVDAWSPLAMSPPRLAAICVQPGDRLPRPERRVAYDEEGRHHCSVSNSCDEESC